MAEPSDTRGVDNNWVMASPEGFVVETLGPDQDPGTAVNGAPADVPLLSHDTESHVAGEHRKSALSSSSMGLQEKEAKEPEAAIAPATFHQTEAVPVGTTPESAKLDIPPDEGLRAEQPGLKVPSLARKAESVSESSSEEDVEGLRKRQVRDVHPVARMAEPDRGMQEETDTWLTLNRCIMAALALVGLGLLVVAGTGYDADNGVLDNLAARDVGSHEPPTAQTVAEIKHWIKEHADVVTGDPQPLHAMNDVLDRLAKENQDIRRMQAELQAQKDELQALLNKSEGEKISVGSKQKNLLEENVRLKELLLQEETAHLSVQEELQVIKEKLQGVNPATFLAENAKLKAERDVERLQIEGFLVQKETLVAEAQMLRQELDKQRLLLTSIRQEMENLTSNSSSLELGVDELRLKEILEGIGSKLKSELQRSEVWEKNYVNDKEQKREKASYSKKGRNSPEDAVLFPNTSASPSSTSAGKLEGSTQLYRSTASTLKESMRNILHGDSKGKWKEGSRDWKESKHSKHVHAEGEGQWPHKKHHHHHHREGGNDPQEHKVAEFDGRKNEWKGIPKDGKWKDRAEAWRERTGPHHHAEAEKKREDEILANVLPHHRDHRGAHRKDEGAQQNRPQWEKHAETGKKEHRHHDHNKFWKKLSDHQYRVPEGCTGVADCARKDGLDLFNKELAPVDKLEFQQLLREYMELQELAKYLPELDSFMSSFFEGDVFMHDRMRFRDFVDDVEDYLEDVAVKEKGDDDAVDDFDKHVFRHYFGEAAVKRRFSKKDGRKTKPLSDSEKKESETLDEDSKHVKTEQGVKAKSPKKQQKLSNPLNQETEMNEQPPGQQNDSKPFKLDQKNKDGRPNTERKSHSNERQTHHHHTDHKSMKNEKNFEEGQSGSWNDNPNPLKHDKTDQERSSEHRPSDPKSIKNEKNLQKRQSSHGRSDRKQSQYEKNLNNAQYDNQHSDPKPSKNEKHSQELKSHQSHNGNRKNQSNKRHSDHWNNNSEKRSLHGHRDLKHEKHAKQSHGGHDDSEHETHHSERRSTQGHDETHLNERWSSHDHHSEHEIHPNEQEPYADRYHSEHETHLNQHQSHHDHHKSKHENPFNEGRSHRDHSDSKYERRSNKEWSHGGHDDSSHDNHPDEMWPLHGHDDSEHEPNLDEKLSHHDHHDSNHAHPSNERWSHHDHRNAKHEKKHKESWSHHSHQDSSQRQPNRGHDDARVDAFDKKRQFKTPNDESGKTLKEWDSYDHGGDSKPFADKKHAKDGHSHHHNNNLKTSHKAYNPKKDKHRQEHSKHSDSKNAKHHKEEGPTYQNHEDGKSFHHKKQMENDKRSSNHHHGGSKAFRDERPSYEGDRDWHKHGHHKGPGKDKTHTEGHK